MRSCAIHVHKYSVEAMLLQQCREVTTVILSIMPWLPTYMGQNLIRCNIPHLLQLHKRPTLISLCEILPWSGITRFWMTKSKYQTLLPHGQCTARSGFAMHIRQSVTKSTAWTGLSQGCSSTAKTPSEMPQAYVKLTTCCFSSSTLSLTSRQMPWQRPNVKTLCSLRQHPPSLQKRFGWQSSNPRS